MPVRGLYVEIESVIANALGIDAQSVVDDLEYRGVPEWNSMAHMRLIVALEDALGVSIDDELVVALTSVSAIREFASKQRSP